MVLDQLSEGWDVGLVQDDLATPELYAMDGQEICDTPAVQIPDYACSWISGAQHGTTSPLHVLSTSFPELLRTPSPQVQNLYVDAWGTAYLFGHNVLREAAMRRRSVRSIAQSESLLAMNWSVIRSSVRAGLVPSEVSATFDRCL
jgi:hypothetical protein